MAILELKVDGCTSLPDRQFAIPFTPERVREAMA